MRKTKETCEYCGGSYEIGMSFCPYCGRTIPTDESTKTINININKRYEDVAESKKVDSKERIELKKLKLKAKEQAWNVVGTAVASIVILVLLIGGALLGYYALKLDDDELYIPKSQYEYIDYNYQELYNEFSALGFTDITLNEISDLKYNDSEINLVTNLSINGNSKFEDGEKFNKSDKVIITYHTVKLPAENEAIIKSSAKNFRYKDFNQVVTELQSMGFTNIQTVALEDLITGWLSTENSVAEISINGNSDFEDGDIFPKDALIVIKYHSF